MKNPMTKSTETSKDIHKNISKNSKSKNIHQKHSLATRFGYLTLHSEASRIECVKIKYQNDNEKC